MYFSFKKPGERVGRKAASVASWLKQGEGRGGKNLLTLQNQGVHMKEKCCQRLEKSSEHYSNSTYSDFIQCWDSC